MPHTKNIHTVAVVIFDGVVTADASIACETFSRVKLACGFSPYTVKVCSANTPINTDFFSIKAPHSLSEIASAQTVIVPGPSEVNKEPDPELLKHLNKARESGARIASICTGAFILAASGLLNGLKATTHWSVTDTLARRYPQIEVDPNVLYVDNGDIFTSAGAMAGIDLCLHLIRKDHGAKVAADTARMSVMAMERVGGQRQFIKHEMPNTENITFRSLLEWIEKNLHNNLSIKCLAEQVNMSTRTLHRRFLEQLGIPPATWVLQRRIRYSQYLLESSHFNIDQIAADAGFGSSANFRDQFRRITGVSPSSYRRSFGIKDSQKHY